MILWIFIFFERKKNRKKKDELLSAVNGCKEILHHCYPYKICEFLRSFIISKVLLISIKKSLNTLF